MSHPPEILSSAPVGRLAPSPTGNLHLGHARTFLIAWWHARSRGGRVLLRIEDLDGDRCNAQYIDGAVRDLAWLGLDWDGPELLQSSRAGSIRETAYELQRRGLAYPCTCSRGDIRRALATRPPAAATSNYPGTCVGRYPDVATAERDGKAAGLRFSTNGLSVKWVDGIVGPVQHDLAGRCGDFLILRRDKQPAYQLAVAVDDANQGVTEVVRGDDLIDSTPGQIALLQALGQPAPSYYHVPLVVDETGKRLAKRYESLGLVQLRQAGVDPRYVVRWVLQSCHPADDSSPSAAPGPVRLDDVDAQDLISAAEALPLFSMGRLNRQPVRLSEKTIQSWRQA